MTHRLSLPLIAALVLASLLSAEDLPFASPNSVEISGERLARIGAAVDQGVADKRISGGVTLVVRHGRVAWYDARGMADREQGKPMRKDEIFRICSMTKPIVSTAVMLLYEGGAFTLEDPISKYLPEFKHSRVLTGMEDGKPVTVAAKGEITIRDLLRHTSGLTYPWNGKVGKIYNDAGAASGLIQYDGTIADSVKGIASVPLLFNPGDKWEYSLSTDVLGRLVEVISGMPLDQFLKQRILDPLEMRDTFFYVPDDRVGRLAAAYTYSDDKGLNRFPDTPLFDGPMPYTADYPYRGPRKLFSGGAGLCSTAMDYARFCQMMLNGGKLGRVRILSRKSVELMTHDQMGKIDSEHAFGLGFGIDGKQPLAEIGTPGTFGWGGFFYTKFIIDPKEDMIVISMMQLHPTGGYQLDARINVLAYQALED